MSDIRQQAIEAGAQALREAGISVNLYKDEDDAADAVVDAVTPIIRADERAKNAPIMRAYEQSFIATLRAQVEALPTTRTRAWDKGWDSVSLNDVLALLDGKPTAHGSTTPTTVSTDVRDSIWRGVQ